MLWSGAGLGVLPHPRLSSFNLSTPAVKHASVTELEGAFVVYGNAAILTGPAYKYTTSPKYLVNQNI